MNAKIPDHGPYAQALTHRSAGARNNERLEFLGDALVNLIAAELLFERFPKADEGAMTRMRASLVREAALAGLARQLGLGERLRLGPGELKSGGQRRDSILADALEALVAAYYLDQGWAATRERVRAWFADLLDAVGAESFGKDAKTRLQEWLQARGLDLPEYQMLDSSGPEHAREFTMRCTVAARELSADARGGSRKLAETLHVERGGQALIKDGRTQGLCDALGGADDLLQQLAQIGQQPQAGRNAGRRGATWQVAGGRDALPGGHLMITWRQCFRPFPRRDPVQSFCILQTSAGAGPGLPSTSEHPVFPGNEGFS